MRVLKLIASFGIGLLSLTFARAGTLERALECRLAKGELPDLIKGLKAGYVLPAHPSMTLALPSMDIYRLQAPVSARGLVGHLVAASPGRIALVVDGTTAEAEGRRLGLERSLTGIESIDSTTLVPWKRAVSRDGAVNVVAFQSSDPKLADKTLVGCEYGYPTAAGWLDDGDLEKFLLKGLSR